MFNIEWVSSQAIEKLQKSKMHKKYITKTSLLIVKSGTKKTIIKMISDNLLRESDIKTREMRQPH